MGSKREYFIKLPRGVEIDIFNLPHNFKEIVEKCFAEYTEETSEEYRYVDKLGFIDVFIRKLNDSVELEDIVDNLYKERVDYEWKEFGNVISEGDVYCQEFMWDCCRRGIEATKLKQHFGLKDHHIYDQIQKVLVEVITIVMNYGD